MFFLHLTESIYFSVCLCGKNKALGRKMSSAEEYPIFHNSQKSCELGMAKHVILTRFVWASNKVFVCNLGFISIIIVSGPKKLKDFFKIAI